MTETQREQLFRYRTSKDSYGPPFEAKRFYDPRFKATSVMVLPGRQYVSTTSDEMIVALLGSSIAACIRDPLTGIGGLNHFLIPESRLSLVEETETPSRDGRQAMDKLVNAIIEQGGERSRLEVKIFGGAGDQGDPSSSVRGQKTAAFIQAYLTEQGFGIAAKSLGGSQPRRIHYFPRSGVVKMLLLRRGPDRDLFKKERAHQRTIRTDDDARDDDPFA